MALTQLSSILSSYPGFLDRHAPVQARSTRFFGLVLWVEFVVSHLNVGQVTVGVGTTRLTVDPSKLNSSDT